MDFQDARGFKGDTPETRLTGESAPAAATAGRGQRVVLQPSAENVVVLPSGATLDDLSVEGRDIVITMADGRVFVIPEGAVYVPQIVIDDVAVPPLNLAALLTGNEPQPAAGTVGSSGGNFADPTGPIQDAYGLGDLLPYTELSFPVEPQEEVLPQPIEDDDVPDVVIPVDGQPASRDAVDTVDEAGLAGDRRNGNQETPGSSSGDGTDVASGTIVVTSVDGVASITINGVVVTGVAGQQIQGSAGVLTLGALNGNQIPYTYALVDNTAGDTTDPFTVVITDGDGDTATATLTIDIVDDVPTARPDTDTVPAADFSAQTGNVLTGEGTTSGTTGADTVGADGAGVTGIRAGTTGEFSGVGPVPGQYGTLTIFTDGSYSYLRTPGTPGGVSDVFSYRITDGDGDTSIATLTIDIGNSEPAIVSVPESGDATEVNENQLPPRGGETPGSQFANGPETASGTIAFHSDDGISSVSLNGTVITPGALPQPVASDGTGTLTVVGYTFDPTTGDGSITYVYTLTDNTADAEVTTVSFEIEVVDADGQAATDTLDIDIFDDAPTAVANTAIVTEGATLTVVAASGVLVNDTRGADGATVTGVAAGSNTASPVSGDVGVKIDGAYGKLTLNADGSYTYQSTANAITGAEKDVFVYTITDGDGDTSTTTLTINLSDVSLVADNQTRQVDEAALDTTTSGADLDHGTVAGSSPASTGETVTGTLAVAGATSYTAASGSTAYGVYEVNADGTYTYTLTRPYTSPSEDDGAQIEAGKDSFSYAARDANGNVVTGTVTIDIRDDVPSVDVILNPEAGVVLTTRDALAIGEAGDAASSAAAFGSVFALSFTAGADGASAPSLSYDLAITDSVSGLTSHGAAITLYELANGTIVGSTAETAPASVSDASVVFSVSVAADGTVTLTQYRQVDHPVDTDPSATTAPFEDHSATLGEGKLTLTASTTITDGDGDAASDSAAIDLGGNLRFLDDGPVADPNTNEVSEGASTSGGVLATDTPGADGFASAPGGAVTGIASVNLGTSDTIANGDTFVLDGEFGTLTLNRDGSYSYKSNADTITGAEQDVFEYTVVDFDGDTSTATLTIDLSDVSLIADNQAKSVNEAGLDLVADDREGTLNDDLASGSVEGSVKDASSETVSGSLNVAGATGYVLVGSTAGAFGQIKINSDGTYTYTLTAPVDGDTTSPAQGGNNNDNTYTGSGVESFTYEATDAQGNTVQGTITISIVDDVPTARDDSASQATENAAFTIAVFGNDTFGADGVDTADATKVFVSSQASQGTVTYDTATKLFTYTPSSGAGSTSTSDSFEYTIVDGDGDIRTATVNVTLLPDSEPEGGERVATVDDDGLTGSNAASVTGDINANIDDAPADSSEATFTGTVDFNVGNDTPATITFEASLHGATAMVGQEQVTYSVSGNMLTATISSGARANTALFQVEILDTHTGEYRVTLLTNVLHAGAPGNSEANNAFASIDFAVADSEGDVTTTNLGILFNDDAPTAYGNGNTVDEGGSIGGNVLSDGTTDAFGADGLGGIVSFTDGVNTAAPDGQIETALGFLTIHPDGSYEYQSKPNSTASAAQDSFTYTIVDADGDTSTATLTIDITPTAGNVSDNDVSVDESGLDNATYTGSQLVPDGEFDTDGQISASGGTPPYSYVLTSPSDGTYGTLTLNGTTGAYSYTLDTPFTDTVDENSRNVVNGAESFGYEVYDDLGNLIGSGTISVNIKDDVPAAADDSNSLNEDTASIGGDVLTNDDFGADGPHGTQQISAVSGTAAGDVGGDTPGTYGTLQLAPGGTYTYVLDTAAVQGLDSGEQVTDTFSYTIQDGDGDTHTAQLTITILGSNDAPVVTGSAAAVSEEGLIFGNPDDNPVSPADADTTDSVTDTGSITISDADTGDAHTVALGTPAQTLYTPDGVTPLTWDLSPDGHTLKGYSTNIHAPEILVTIDDAGNYTVTLGGPVEHTDTTTEDLTSFIIPVTVSDGTVTTILSNGITVTIEDDSPLAVADSSELLEGASTSGNVLQDSDVGGDSTPAWPSGAIVGISSINQGTSDSAADPADNFVLTGAYGTLTMNRDGTYVYQSTANSVTATDEDVFEFTMVDADGDSSTARLTINVLAVTLAANNQTKEVDEAALDTTLSGSDLGHGTVTGSNPGSTAETVTGTLNVTGPSGAITYVAQSQTTAYGIFQLKTDGTYTYTLTSPYTTTPDTNNGAVVEPGVETFTYTAHDVYGNSVTGTVTIDVKDDVPTAITPKTTSMNNAVGASGGNYLDDNNDVDDDYGADGGTVIFTSATIASMQSQNLTSGFAPLNYAISADGTVLTATKSTNGSTVFTISLQPGDSPDQYVVNISQKLDSVTTIDFNAGNYNFEGGNSSWAGFVVNPETLEGKKPTTIDNNSLDLLLTPEINGVHAGTLKTTANIGGVSDQAAVDSTETFRVDFVTDLRGDPGDGPGQYEEDTNRDHLFDGHYTVNGVSALFKSTSNSTVTISAYDDADGNTIVGDGNQDTINGVVITWRGGLNSGLITSNGVYNVNGHNFTVTFNAGGSVTVAGIEGANGESMIGTVVAVYTANGYNSVEYTHAGGDPFQIGDFGATVQTTNPVNFTVPVTIVDNDGDTAAGGSLAITLNAVPPVALDLDGDGVEYLGLGDGVAHDYGDGLVQTAWVAADDGLLAHDTGNGLDIVFTDDAAGATTDLEGLRLAYDSNRDGMFTASDAAFSEFGVWQDANSNGTVDEGEFRSLLTMGITSIGLTSDGVKSTGAGGDVTVHGTGQYTMKGTTYALADVSLATRTTEIAAVSLAAAGFMATQTASAQPLTPEAIEAVAATVQTFEASTPEIQASLAETGQEASFVAPLEEQAQDEQTDVSNRSVTDASDDEAQQGFTEIEQQDFAPEPLAASDDVHPAAGTLEFSFGGSDSALMQALLLVNQAGETGASDEPKVDLPAVQEAMAESADQQAVDTLIDHFAGQDSTENAAVTDTALDHALGTMLAGFAVDGLHAAMGGGFEMAAMAVAVETHLAAA